MMDEIWIIITWTLAVICLAGNVLNVKKIRFCFLIWMACNIVWIVYDVIHTNYARVLLDSVQIGFDLWGFITWKKKPEINNKDL